MTMQYGPSYVRQIAPYVAGKPISEVAREFGLDEARIVKLASNENPLGMPESAKAAMVRAASELGRYPDANAFELKGALAARYGVPTCSGGENPYAIQSDLQQMMQNLVGIVRTEREMCDALDGLAGLKTRASHAAVSGHREYNPGWHTALDLRHLLTVSEAITRSALERKESRGGHFREDFPQKDPRYATFNIVSRKGTDGSMEVARVPIPQMPAELKQVIEQQK